MLEMLVSLGVFSVAAVIAIGALVRMTSLNRSAQALQSAMNNVSFALESISREMRVGTNYTCASYTHDVNGYSFTGSNLSTLPIVPCHSATQDGRDQGIFFKSTKTDPANPSCALIYAYWFIRDNNWSFRKSQQTICGSEITSNDAKMFDEVSTVLTDYDLSKTEGVSYPLVSIRLVGYAGVKASERESFDVRTAISQRISN